MGEAIPEETVTDVTLDNAPDRDAERVDVPSDEELQAILDQENIHMEQQDFDDLKAAVPEMVREDSPELAQYLEELSPRLDEVLKASAAKKESGDERGSVDVLVTFMEEEMKKLEAIPNEALRAQILSVLGDTVNFKQLADDLKKYAKADVASSAVDLIPVVGSAKITGEAALGKTASGQKLEGGKRALHALTGVTFLALDIAGLGTAGLTTAASEAGKAAQAVEKGAEVAMLATKVARIANLLAKSAKFERASAQMVKFGALIVKYPKLSHALLTMHTWKKHAKMAYKYGDKTMRARQLAALHEEVETKA